eukprot:1184820-Amphidinium_carterae.1
MPMPTVQDRKSLPAGASHAIAQWDFAAQQLAARTQLSSAERGIVQCCRLLKHHYAVVDHRNCKQCLERCSFLRMPALAMD